MKPMTMAVPSDGYPITYTTPNNYNTTHTLLEDIFLSIPQKIRPKADLYQQKSQISDVAPKLHLRHHYHSPTFTNDAPPLTQTPPIPSLFVSIHHYNTQSDLCRTLFVWKSSTASNNTSNTQHRPPSIMSSFSKRASSRSPEKGNTQGKRNKNNKEDVIPMEDDTPQNLATKFNEAAKIKTTANGQLYDISTLFKTNEDLNKARVPYKTAFGGEGEDCFHDDQASATRIIAKLSHKVGNLSQAQLHDAKTKGFDLSEMTIQSIAIITKTSEAIDLLTETELQKFSHIMCRLAHTKPNVMGRIIKSTMPDTLWGRFWYGAVMALGSHYAAPAKSEPKKQSHLNSFFSAKNAQPRTTPPNSSSRQPAAQSSKPTETSTDTSIVIHTTGQVTPSPTGTNNNDGSTKPLTIQLGRNKKAKGTAETRNHRSRLTIMVHVSKDKSKTAVETFLGTFQSMFGRYKSYDNAAVLLPWWEKDQDTTRAIESTSEMPTEKMSDIRTYLDKARPKENSNIWFKIHIAHDEPPIHFTSLDGSDTADWFDDNGAKAFLQAVDSDDVTQIGMLIYSGPFINHEHLQELLQKKRPNLKMGLRLKKNKDIPTSTANDGPRRPWKLDHTQAIHIECHRPQSRQVKQFVYNTFNRVTNPSDRLGGYNLRALPEATYMRGGTKATANRANILRKHTGVVKSLELTSTDIIVALDIEVHHNGKPITLRQILHALPFPLATPDEELQVPERPLINSVDFASSGQDKNRGIVYVTAYHDRASVMERFIDILPTFLDYAFDDTVAKKFCSAIAIAENKADQITMGFDNDGNWNGQWTTQEDDLLQDIIDQDMGIQLDLSEFEELQHANRPLLNADDTSVVSNATAFGAKNQARNDAQDAEPPHRGQGQGQPQGPALMDSAVQAQLVAARQGSGAAV